MYFVKYSYHGVRPIKNIIELYFSRALEGDDFVRTGAAGRAGLHHIRHTYRTCLQQPTAATQRQVHMLSDLNNPSSVLHRITRRRRRRRWSYKKAGPPSAPILQLRGWTITPCRFQDNTTITHVRPLTVLEAV